MPDIKIKYEGEKPRVFIGMPTLGEVSVWNARNLIEWGGSDAYDVVFHPQAYMTPHDSARNAIIEAFLKSECSHLFMLDSFVMPVAYYLDVLLAHDLEHVAAIAQAIQKDAKGHHRLVPVAHRLKDGKAQPFWEKGLQECYWTTCACTLMKREAVKKLELPAFDFTYNEYGIRKQGEDFNFCEKVRDAGIKLHVDFDLLCSHSKSLDMKLINKMLLQAAKKGVIEDGT